jgi:ammonia channel protein AmtB
MKLLVALVWILFGYSLAFGEDLPVKKSRESLADLHCPILLWRSGTERK